MAIIPARVVKPRDKAAVESSVGWLETWLLEWLKGKLYFSFEALNHDIRERVLELARRPFKHREGSRESVFLALDKPCLRPIPKDTFESYITKPVKSITNNYHVEYDRFYYSVPYQYYKKPAVIHAFAKKVEVFTKEGDRIAIHPRRFTGKRYVTIAEHMPPNHQAVVAFRAYNGTYYRSKACAIGPTTGNFVKTLLEKADFEEQAYKSCMGVLNFARTHGNVRVERACEKAFSLHSVTYTTLKNILKNGQESQPAAVNADADTPTPYHENLRVGEWK